MNSNTHCHIASVGSYLPEEVITSRHVDDRLNGLRYLNLGRMIENITGMKESRYVPKEVQASELAIQFALDALKEANGTADDVDTILSTSCSRDVTEPATVRIVQSKFSALKATRVMDVTNAAILS
jgi:3-oxoacyl-[acyl-carrier-protein] synthase-3